MISQTERFRKAAILVASLDETSAAALYESFSEADACTLRQAVDDLAEIGVDEQQAVLAEFLDDRARGSDDVGVELDDNLARRLAGFEHLSPTAPAVGPAARSHGFRELADLDTEALIQGLAAEHPQTVAVVLAQLTPARAAELLRRWDPSARHELLDRITTLSPTSPELLREIEQELLTRIRAQAEEVASARHSEARVAAILAAADEPVRSAWRDHRGDALAITVTGETPLEPTVDGRDGLNEAIHPALAEREPPLEGATTSLREPAAATENACLVNALAWEDLGRFDDESLAMLYASAPAEVVRLALVGADVGMVQRMRRHLGIRAARLLDRQLHRLDAVRISDIVEAQQRLGELAGRLVHDGVLRSPNKAS